MLQLIINQNGIWDNIDISLIYKCIIYFEFFIYHNIIDNLKRQDESNSVSI